MERNSPSDPESPGNAASPTWPMAAKLKLSTPIDPSKTAGLSPPAIIQVAIHDIIIGDRTRPLDFEAVERLAESLGQNNAMLQPVLVTPEPYHLVDGLYRVEAARLAGWDNLPAIVLPDDANLQDLAGIDANLYRKPLSVLEQAEHLARRREVLNRMGLMAQSGSGRNVPAQDASPDTVSPVVRTVADLGTDAGLGERDVQRRLRIATLTQETRNVLRSSQVADQTTVLNDLAGIGDPGLQVEIARRLAEGRSLTVRDARNQIRKAKARAEDLLKGPVVEATTAGPKVTLYYGWDMITALRLLPDGSVHAIVTSPPYWRLRRNLPVDHPLAHLELGQEKTPEEYIAKLVAILRELRRVLRRDGTLWLNLGDTYGDDKNLLMIPARVALALQADGWVLRSQVPWVKPSKCMPESVTDRPVASVEYVFLLALGPDYYYDQDAVRVSSDDAEDTDAARVGGRSRRSGDWFVEGLLHDQHGPTALVANPRPFRGAHFSTFSPEMVEPMVLASTSGGGCCPVCGARLRRLIERVEPAGAAVAVENANKDRRDGGARVRDAKGGTTFRTVMGRNMGWRPTCEHGEAATGPVACTVLDPFSGSATTGYVAALNGMNFIGIDLNEEYQEVASERLRGVEAQIVRVKPQ